MTHTNHDANTRVWKMGDLVIHDDDAKRPDMLMRVLGQIASGPNKGKFRTQYYYPEHQPKAWRKRIWVNGLEKLHDPARFNINTAQRPSDRFSRDLPQGHRAEAPSWGTRPTGKPRTDGGPSYVERFGTPGKLSPYLEAINWIEQHPGSGSASRLARLILSLWNSDACFSFRECIDSLDDTRTAIAVACVARFAVKGETDDLVRAGYRVHAMFPTLWDIGQAGTEAKRATRDSFEKARSALAYDRDTGNPDTDGRP